MAVTLEPRLTEFYLNTSFYNCRDWEEGKWESIHWLIKLLWIICVDQASSMVYVKTKPFCPLQPGVRVWGKYNIVKHWLEQWFTHIEKRKIKTNFSRGCGTPMVIGSLLAVDARQWVCTHPFILQQKGPMTSSQGRGILVGLARYHMTHTVK